MLTSSPRPRLLSAPPQRGQSVALDPAQRRAVALEPDRSLLVTGAAGFGKTTAALHRLVHLGQGARETGRPFDALVLAPTDGLGRVCRAILRGLGADVPVRTLDPWIRALGRRAFPDVPAKDSLDTSAAVIRFKRHPAVREVLEALDGEGPARWTDLFELWGDTRLLRDVVDASGGGLTGSLAAAVHAHACVQFAPATEARGLFGMDLDDGTPMQDAQSLDAEDFPVLFALDAVRGIDRVPHRYHHIVVDEAQEVAPMELALVGRCLAPGGALTLAGDADQQVDPTAWFTGWQDALAAAGRPDGVHVTLRHSYRCPPAIVRFGQALLAGHAPGDAVPRSLFATRTGRARALAAELGALPPGVSAAVVTRTPHAARRIARELREDGELSVRLVLDGTFPCGGGVAVTAVDHVRGLAFDVVVVPDLCETGWPDCPANRRALHVALTRTTHQAWLAAVGTWSGLFR